MSYQLGKLDPTFRLLADQLFFTDRTDLDTSELKAYLDFEEEHYRYLCDRFLRSTEIFWDESFWIHRFELLLSLEIKKLEVTIESLLLERFNYLLTHTFIARPEYHNSFIQIIAWTRVKVFRKENIKPIKDLLLRLPYFSQADKITGIVEKFTPFLFQDIAEYVAAISKDVGQSARSFEIISKLAKQGIVIDKEPMFKMARDLLFKRVPNRPNRRAFFAMLDDGAVFSNIKDNYKPEHKERLMNLIKKCEFREIEEYHLRNIKNLLALDDSISDELLKTYADRLYSRGTGNKKANVQRLIRACKSFPQFSPKKLLAYYSSNNRMQDIKYLVKAFPDLKPLVPFV